MTHKTFVLDGKVDTTMRYIVLTMSFLAFTFAGGQRVAANQCVRISVKHVLDSEGNRSNGDYTEDSAIVAAIGDANTVLANNDSTWRLELLEIVDVPGICQYFDITGDQKKDMEDDAEADPSTYHWRFDVINIYVVNTLDGGAERLDNWSIRERVFTMEHSRWERAVGCTGFDIPRVVDEEDVRIITGTMARFPTFHETGWRILRSARIIRSS